MLNSLTLTRLLTLNVYLDTAALAGPTVEISDSSDFTNDETLSLIIKNGAVNLRLTGSLTKMVRFQGFELVKNVDILAAGITEIPEKCFYQNNYIETVTLHGGVTKIAQNAFTYSSLRSINLENVETIGQYSFQKCYNLQSVTLKSIKSLGAAPFYSSGIETASITLSDELTIPASCFENCLSLTKVSFVSAQGSQNLILGDYVFNNCPQLQTVTSTNVNIGVGDYAFANTALTSFPFELATSIGSYSFMNTKMATIKPASGTISFELSQLTFQFNSELQTVDLSGITGTFTNSYGLFYGCSSLTTVTLPASLTKLPDAMFKDCTALTSVTASGLTEISTDGFMSCSALTNLQIGSQLTTVGYRGLYDCQKLNVQIQNCILKERALYNCQSITTISVKGLGSWCCMNMSNLNTVTVSYSPTSIPTGCFMYCTKLQSFTIPASCSSIGDLAFAYTYLPIQIDLQNVEVLGNYSFMRSNVSGVYMRKQIQEEGKPAFFECPNLKNIRIGQRILRFWMVPFTGCNHEFEFQCDDQFNYWVPSQKIFYSVYSVAYVAPDAVIPYNLWAIMILNGAFMWYKKPFDIATNVKQYYFLDHSTVTTLFFSDDAIGSQYYGDKYSIGDFSYCTSLTKVHLAPTIKYISTGCFYMCTNLTQINLENVIAISHSVFAGCVSLESINISKATEVLSEAFINCTGLKNVVFPSTFDLGSLVGIGHFGNTGFEELYFNANIQNLTLYKGMFVNCKKLTKVVFGPNVVSLPDSMFENSSLSVVEYSDSLTSIGNMTFARTNIQTFTIKGSLTDIYPIAFYGAYSINIVVSPENTKYEIIDGNHLIEKSSKSLVCLFGKIPNTFKLSEEIRVLKDASLASAPEIDSNTGKVIDWGITTLIIPGNIRVEDKMEPVRYTPYLHNLCYGGIDQPPLLNSMAHRYFVTSNYSKDFWVLSEEGDMDNENYIGVIRAPCSNFTPYDKFNQREFYNLYDCPTDEIIEEEPTETPTPELQKDLPTNKKISTLLLILIIVAAVETVFLISSESSSLQRRRVMIPMMKILITLI
ncbi:surface antigen BspA-like [Trichomonas vaginalis G3]|uniref:Surface antigen BspA-like n=1 Tax=Trichomonas vaginalis (strain ATCC PRA-98 / G3) TaxID=412133 RepID=A2E6Q3_TRIV3|nr:antigen BSP-related family [Trichomonas vaginalis G3]EAY11647.1 surface antigen BspA-like [Trichomonas vaginalis G3]KAI5494948.1 antigen BSP-related family [Trichomonas vaginalis G3]|eukprot:XP_001323870.1 surface antigen BspA-like [Trichomonas vaginalis G3]